MRIAEVSMRSANEGIGFLVRLALLIAAGLVLFVLDSLLPKPVPFMRYGLANIAVLYVLAAYGFRYAWIAGGIKAVAGALITGTFPGVPFVLSAGATAAGLAAMGLAALPRGCGMSLLGISVAGAVAHTVAQLVLVGVLFTEPGDVAVLAAVLAPVAVVSGAVTAFVVRRLLTGMHGGPH